MTKILITGGAGNIGSSLAHRLVLNGDYHVVIADNLSTGSLENVPDLKKFKNLRMVKCDVNEFNDISPLMTAHQFDYVFHYAAVVGVQRTLANPSLVLRDIEGIKHILNLSKNTGVKRVFYSSSSEVYGEPVEIPQDEKTTPLNSRLPYAIVKNLGEAFCQTYHYEYGQNYTIFRFFNTYGEYQTNDFVISKFIRLAMMGEPLTIYGDGMQSRTFCYINDNIDFTLLTLEGDHFHNEVVNVGNDQEISIKDLAHLVKEVLKSSSPIIHIDPLKEGDMTRRLPDLRKMKKVLNKKLTSLEEGVRIVASKLSN
jgi:UDP-glucose 4-epimerase